MSALQMLMVWVHLHINTTYTYTHTYSTNTLFCIVILLTAIYLQGHAAQKVTNVQLHKRVERVAYLLQEKARRNSGDHIALLYPPGNLVTNMCSLSHVVVVGLDLIVSFYACLYVGKYCYYSKFIRVMCTNCAM